MRPRHKHTSRAKRRRRRRLRLRRLRRRAELQVSGQRNAVTEPETGRSFRGSLLKASRNVEIRGGQLISAGHYVNTINFNSNLEPAMSDSSKHTKNSPFSPGIPDNGRDSEPIADPPPLPVWGGVDIYDQQMTSKGRGRPLQHPGPSRTLPDAYRRRGIAVGDVGILTKFRSFDFMFNICLPADHPINQQGLPDRFSPLFPPLHPSDICIRPEFNQGTYLASALVEKSHNDSSGMTFETSASEGAILALPQGADAEDLLNVSRFRQYLSANAASWYKYVNDSRGREARNGDLQLVVGCDKASSWGMASFANSTEQDLYLKFNPTNQGGFGWEYSGVVDARAGPNPEEMEGLRSTDDSGHPHVYQDQCLFVRTLPATLRDDVWQGLGFD